MSRRDPPIGRPAQAARNGVRRGAYACSMIEIREAQPGDIDELIPLESALFAEDAAVHDPFSDPTWPRREGRRDFEDLIASPESVLLVASSSEGPVGLLAGYSAQASPTRQPVRFAVLRTLFVTRNARRSGAATMLVDRFLTWARDQGCVEAHVDHYAANHGAAQFYDRVGFNERSISRVLPLGAADEPRRASGTTA